MPISFHLCNIIINRHYECAWASVEIRRNDRKPRENIVKLVLRVYICSESTNSFRCLLNDTVKALFLPVDLRHDDDDGVVYSIKRRLRRTL